MNEEEFLKEHPSLNHKLCEVFRDDTMKLSVIDCAYTSCAKFERYVLDLDDIHETQLDKQKVKEAINSNIVDCCDCGCNFGKDKLKKELGLD